MANDLYLPQEPSYIQLARKPQYSSYIISSLVVKVFDVLSATSPPHHLRVFSTLLCLFSSSSNSLPSCYPLISPYMPPISELAALVSFCPPHVTLPRCCSISVSRPTSSKPAAFAGFNRLRPVASSSRLKGLVSSVRGWLLLGTNVLWSSPGGLRCSTFFH